MMLVSFFVWTRATLLPHNATSRGYFAIVANTSGRETPNGNTDPADTRELDNQTGKLSIATRELDNHTGKLSNATVLVQTRLATRH